MNNPLPITLKMRRHVLLSGVVLAGLFLMMTLVVAQDDAPLYTLPGTTAPVIKSGSLVTIDGGSRVVATNMLNDTVSIMEPFSATLIAEVPVGDDPRSVALTDDATRALIVNRGDESLTVLDLETQTSIGAHPLGVLPYAVVTDNDASAFVSLQGRHEVIELELATGDVLRRIPTPAYPAGLTLWGDFLYVTHLWSGDLSMIYLPQSEVVRTISTGADTSLSQTVAINRATGRAYLPQSRSNTINRTATFDTTIFPVVNVVDLATMQLIREERITLDTADRPVNMPFDIAVDAVRDFVYVANAGSDDLSVINLNTGLVEAHRFVGANPRGVVLNRDNSQVFVHNMIDGSLTIIETRQFGLVDVLPISDLTVAADIFLGAQLFHSANDPRMSRDHWISCASCHFDGLSDGRVWQTASGLNTPVLFGLPETAPYTWGGEWDELADLELHLRDIQYGAGLIEDVPVNPASGEANTLLSFDLDNLTAYLATLNPPSAPPAPDAALVERGAAVYDELGCTECHTDGNGDGGLHDVGRGGEFNTPTLNWLWLSAPYFHDGRAATLQEVFLLEGAHQLYGTVPNADIEALVAYLSTLPQD